MPNTPPVFWFDKGTGVFYTNDGETVPLRKVAKLSGLSIDKSAQATAKLAKLVADGSITPEEWAVLMKTEIKQEYIRQYLLGHGGRLDDMTHSDWGKLGNMIKDQYRYLRGFAGDVSTGDLSEEQIAARAGMYANSSREAYERARGKVMDEAGMDEEAWALGPKQDHCDDCVGYSQDGWMPIGTFPDPGDGTTQCLTNCGCTKIYRSSETGYEETLE
jgi:hypothetical protein